MRRYKEGESVIVKYDDSNVVGMILGLVKNQKVTLYDIILENKSVINAVPVNDIDKNIYVSSTLTSKLCETGTLQSNLNYRELIDSGSLPAYRETCIGPRSY